MPHWKSQTAEEPPKPDKEPEPSPSASNGATDGASATGDDALESGSHVAATPIEGASGDHDMAAGDLAAGGKVLSRDQFFKMFCAAHATPGAMLGLPSLREAPNHPAAREASDALYDTALEVPALRFLIEVQGKWLQRAMTIAAFAVPVWGGAAMELRQRRGGRRGE